MFDTLAVGPYVSRHERNLPGVASQIHICGRPQMCHVLQNLGWGMGMSMQGEKYS